MKSVIELRTSPHLHKPISVQMIMRNVVYALVPICAYSVWLFGVSALVLLVTTTAACLATESFFCRISGRESSLGDWSAAITGLLLGLVLPPGFPLWMAAVGGFIAIAPGKMLFGGMGFNVFNPALVARAFLQAAFPVAIMGYTPALALRRFQEFVPSTFAIPLIKAAPLADWIARHRIDAFSGATPLMAEKFDHVHSDLWPMLVGARAGSSGETPAILIVLCGLYLIARRFMDWRIPVAMIGSAFVASSAFYLADASRYPNPAFMMLSGGLVLGAMFMATDPVSSPVTPLGIWIYGSLIGVITVLIRIEGGLAEGVMYAILLGNALSPLIDNLTQPRMYGARKKEAAV